MENKFYVDAFVKHGVNIGIVDKISEENILVSWFGEKDESELIKINDELEIIPPNNESLEIGDKVKLNTVFYPINTDENPHDLTGTVIDYDGYWFYIDWENGAENTYRGLDVDLIKI